MASYGSLAHQDTLFLNSDQNDEGTAPSVWGAKLRVKMNPICP